jgi:protein TonB
MATAGTSPALAAGGGSIVLETHRGAHTIPITLHYQAVREVRELASQPDAEISGLLLGRSDGDGLALERAATASVDPDAVGIFRLQPGGWTALTLADRKKLNAAGLARGVVLVVRTLAQRPWSATLFTVDPEVPGGDAPLAEFPWDEYLLQNGWLLDLAPPDPRLAHPTLPGKPDRSRRWIMGAALVLSAAAGAAAAYQWLPGLRSPSPTEVPVNAPPPAATPGLGLKVVHQAQDVEILWDRGSEPVRLARAGTLTIRRGLSTRVIQMRPDQLREGLVVFQPLAGVDSDVRLEVVESGGISAVESAQVLGLDSAPPVPLPEPPASARPAPATPPALPTPVRGARKAPPQRVSAAKEAPQKTAAAKDVPVPPGVRKPGAIAPAPARNGAVPLRRATPLLTSDVAREMAAAQGKVMVSVLISIDAAGKPEDAKVLASSGEPSNSGPYIRLASLAAARQWRFRPATTNGKPVPSEMTVLFTF